MTEPLTPEEQPDAPVTETNGTSGSKNPVASGVESALRATMGLFSMSKEEAQTIINRMIERGELAEKDGRRIMNDLFGRPKKTVKQVNQKVESVVDESVTNLLNAFNIPTSEDLRILSEKINELTEKVEELSKKVSS